MSRDTTLRDQEAFREKLLRCAVAATPSAVQDSSVAIVRGNGPVVEPLGSGTLFAVADRRFVVTATHVVAKARQMDAALGISNHHDFVATPGNWAASVPDRSTDTSIADVAIYPLDNEQVRRLAGKTFLRTHDVDWSKDLARAYFTLVGYPRMYSDLSSKENEPVLLGGAQFSTALYMGDVGGLKDYDPAMHLLLDASDEHLYDAKGAEWSLRGAHEVRVPFPDGLEGISGCAIWRLGKPNTQVEHWKAVDARLVAVQTGFYQTRDVNVRQIIKATRWSFVTTLIAARFPELTAALRLHE